LVVTSHLGAPWKFEWVNELLKATVSIPQNIKRLKENPVCSRTLKKGEDVENEVRKLIVKIHEEK